MQRGKNQQAVGQRNVDEQPQFERELERPVIIQPVLLSDQFYSRFYYFRGSLRSTHSAHETINALSKNVVFQALLAKYDRTEHFEELRSTAAKVFEEVARMRTTSQRTPRTSGWGCS